MQLVTDITGPSCCHAFFCRKWRPSENYLVQFTGEQLSDQELYKIWDAYDVNGDGKMDREELSFLMEDLCEVRCDKACRGAHLCTRVLLARFRFCPLFKGAMEDGFVFSELFRCTAG